LGAGSLSEEFGYVVNVQRDYVFYGNYYERSKWFYIVIAGDCHAKGRSAFDGKGAW
jgi:hypothetical protein